MRDAFGGVFMMRLLLVFIFIYVSFTAVSLNYAKAYRLKNSVISFIEENEISDIKTFFTAGESDENSKQLQKLNIALANTGYMKTCSKGNGAKKDDTGKVVGYCYNGIVIEKSPNSTNKIIYYDVSTFADWNLGQLNNIIALFSNNTKVSGEYVQGTWKITGQAKVKIR